MKTGKKLFWGVLFLLGAVALIIGGMGYFEDFGFWTILWTIGLIGLLVKGIFNRSFGSILFSLALLAIVYDKQLEIEQITPWTVLGAALLGTIGLNILFPKFRRNKYKKEFVKIGELQNGVQGEPLDGENIHFEVNFGESVKYVTGHELEYAHLECSFGSLIVYLNNAVMKSGEAEIHTECSFGSTVLYVPADWRVVLKVDSAFGGVEEKGHCNPEGSNTLYIRGDVSFGSLEIRYL